MSIETYSSREQHFLSAKIQAQQSTNTLSPKAPFPNRALVELSNWCNHACVFCTNPRMVRAKGFLDIDIYRRFVKEAAALGLTEIGLYTTGEPFFVKNLVDFVSIAKAHEVPYVYITTNGALATMERVEPLLRAGLDSLKFSVNAGTRETYRLVHGKDDFHAVVANMRAIAARQREAYPALRLSASCVVTKYAEHERQTLIDTIGDLVEEIVFVGVGGQGGQSLDQLALLESALSDKPPKLGEATPCAMLWNRLHVTREGYLTLCCVDYENALSYADLNHTSVETAWNNQTIVEMRQRQIAQELENTLCHNCLYNAKDPFEPITRIGRLEGVGFESVREKGLTSVSERIDQLEKHHLRRS